MGKLSKIAIIAGARPNFMKVAPLCRELARQKMPFVLINTGQHFSKVMAQDFFTEFNLKPDYHLKPSQNSVVKQVADIMTGLEKIFMKEQPALVVVVGDVNSTLAGALVANKLHIPLAHVEAGLRSFNKDMPEEHNRVLTDHLSDYLFVTQAEGVKNLKREGITKQVYAVGNIMIDTLKLFGGAAKATGEKYYFCTLHRAENVDDKKIFQEILNALAVIARDCTIYLPLHPRTKKMAEKFGLMPTIRRTFTLLPPLNYSQTISYQRGAKLILTDSGGVQEEASFLGVPCLTLRTETERPVTVTKGTSVIGGVSKHSILRVYKELSFKRKKTNILYWDGKTAVRIVGILKKVI